MSDSEPIADVLPRASRAVVVGLLLLMAATLVCRLLFLTSSTNMWDSPSYVIDVNHVLSTGRSQASSVELGHPLYIALVAGACRLSRAIGGPADPETAAKLLGILLNVSSLLPLLWIGRWLFRNAAWGLLAAALSAVVPLTWWWSGEVMSDQPGAAFMVWTLGALACWLEGRRWPWLVAACLLLGASALIRVPALTIAPLFGLAVLQAAWRRRQWLPLVALFLIPLPVLAFVAYQAPRTAGITFLDFFSLTSQNKFRSSGVVDTVRWSEVWARLVNALGPGALWAACLGALVAALRRRGLFLVALLWVGPVIFIQATGRDTMIRYYLPIMAPAALLLAALVEGLRQLRYGREIAAAAVGGLVAIMVTHAGPNLVALRDRVNVLEATARWYASETPENALIVGKQDSCHVVAFSERESVRYAPRFRGKAFDTDTRPDRRARDFIEVVEAVDTALRAGRPVYTSNLMAARWWKPLASRYGFRTQVVFDAAGLRNGKDPGFVLMDATWRATHEVRIEKLVMNGEYPRSAPAPAVEVRRGDVGGKDEVVLRIHAPFAAGRVVGAVAGAERAALDWSSERFGRDPLLQATLARVAETNVTLDTEGRGVVRLTLSGAEPAVNPPFFVSYAVFDDKTGLQIGPGAYLMWLSLPAEIVAER
jgi:4-amino-4-deoxy-L-arabinose transferase-like glycosyltransferase